MSRIYPDQLTKIGNCRHYYDDFSCMMTIAMILFYKCRLYDKHTNLITIHMIHFNIFKIAPCSYATYALMRTI